MPYRLDKRRLFAALLHDDFPISIFFFMIIIVSSSLPVDGPLATVAQLP